jgi:hypothetical protein
MESGVAYEIGFIPKGHSKPTSTATDETCPTPGRVLVISNGQAAPNLEANCSLAKTVAAALPRGKGSWTRQQAIRVCRDH